MNMTEHKTDMNIKTEKYKNLNMAEHKADMSITKIGKYKKTEQPFYDGAVNRTQLHFESSNKHIKIQQRSTKPQNSPQKKKFTKIFNQQLTRIRRT